MQDSIFTKIIKGEIPCHKVYEDEKTIAFLDIHPVKEGMVLVVPKTQVDNFYDLKNEDYHALWDTVRKIAKKMKEVFPNEAKIGIQVEGLDVPHAHVKIFPISTGEDFRKRPDFSVEADQNELAEMAKKLAF